MVTLSPSWTGSTLPSTPSPTARSRYRIPESVRTSLVPSYLQVRQQKDRANGMNSRRCSKKVVNAGRPVSPRHPDVPWHSAQIGRPYPSSNTLVHSTRPHSSDTLLSASCIVTDHKHATLYHVQPTTEQAAPHKELPSASVRPLLRVTSDQYRLPHPNQQPCSLAHAVVLGYIDAMPTFTLRLAATYLVGDALLMSFCVREE